MSEDVKLPTADMPDDELIALVRERYTNDLERDPQRELRREDMRFLNGDSDNNWQWQDSVLAFRRPPGKPARPCLTINKTAQHHQQIANEMRQNRISIKVRPVDDSGDKEIAEVYDGIIRHIEDVSDAHIAYTTAVDHQVAAGLGYWRIVTEYCDDKSFDQDILIRRIENPLSVIFGPHNEPHGGDADHCTVVDAMSRDEFKRRWPKHEPASWEEDPEGWVTRDDVRVCEHFYAVYSKRTLVALHDGATKFQDELGELDFPALDKEGQPRTRSVMERRMYWCKMTAFAVLEKREWPSRYVGVIRIPGKEMVVEGERIVKGIVRNAKDPARMYNYYVSSAAESIALQPKAPYIGYLGQFAGIDQWQTANYENYAYLEVNPVVDEATGQVLPLPQRAQPPLMPPAYIQGMAVASDDLKASTGLYDASLGARSNETSGKAIIARDRQGDVANYHFLDYAAIGIRQTGRVLIDMIPRVWDVKRVARLLGEDGTHSMAQLDPEQEEAVTEQQDEYGEIKKIYNLGVGRYDVTATVGPSYTTKRAEAADMMTEFAGRSPGLLDKAGDLIFKSFDIPGADKMADRLRKFLPPQVVEGEDADESDAKQMLAKYQQIIPQMEQGLQNASAAVDQLRAEMAKLQQQNMILKVQLANKAAEIAAKQDAAQGEIEQEHIRAETQLEIARMREETARMQQAIDEQLARIQAFSSVAPHMMNPQQQEGTSNAE